VIGVLDIPSDDEDLQCVEYLAAVCVRNAFARDRSNELICEWDSIHLDGVSWHPSGGDSLTCVVEFLRTGGVVQQLHRSNT
jgi:hypothetical protein